MKKRLCFTFLIAFTLFLGVNAYAELNPFAWYENAFQLKVEKDEVALQAEDEILGEEIDNIMNIALQEMESDIHNLESLILGKTATSIENHKSSYLSQLEETEKELQTQNYEEYEKAKLDEINEEITEDIEYFLNEVLN